MTSRVNRPLYLLARRTLRILLKPVAHIVFGYRVEHPENLPGKRRPLIMACNHAARVDSVLAILSIRPRFTICGARSAYFATAPRRILMALANILEVESRDQLLSDCGELLAAGETLLVYPEGKRNPEGLGDFKVWVAELALRHDVPILPCFLHGTTKGHRGRRRLIVGRELEPRGDATTLTRCLREAIEGLGATAELTRTTS